MARAVAEISGGGIGESRQGLQYVTCGPVANTLKTVEKRFLCSRVRFKPATSQRVSIRSVCSIRIVLLTYGYTRIKYAWRADGVFSSTHHDFE